MRKMLSLPSILFLSLLTGCGSDGNVGADLEEFTAKPVAEVSEGDFIYRLIAENEMFAAGGPVSMYAELEYTGEQESVDIFHAASPFFFELYEKTRDYHIPYAMNEPLLTTTLFKGEPLREYYQGSGGYSQEDPADYREFTDQIINGRFPSGFYQVNGSASFYTGNPEKEKMDYDIHAHISFKVVE